MIWTFERAWKESRIDWKELAKIAWKELKEKRFRRQSKTEQRRQVAEARMRWCGHYI